ncbi:hypothetical protein [Nostoc sp.]|uniref:hypothetical protein n=1 Tax=Nostoc sp. TaxID=1180 RepID=UPI002FFB2064
MNSVNEFLILVNESLNSVNESLILVNNDSKSQEERRNDGIQTFTGGFQGHKRFLDKTRLYDRYRNGGDRTTISKPYEILLQHDILPVQLL